jgi:hypothetical protein
MSFDSNGKDFKFYLKRWRTPGVISQKRLVEITNTKVRIPPSRRLRESGAPDSAKVETASDSRGTPAVRENHAIEDMARRGFLKGGVGEDVSAWNKVARDCTLA